MQKQFSTIHPEKITSKQLLHKERNRVELGNWNGEKVVVKTYAKIPFFNRFFYTFVRPSKAQRAFENAKKLLEKGILTPQPFAYNDVFTNGIWLSNSWLISEWIPYDFSFRELIEEPQSFDDWETIVRETANFIIQLYQNEVLFNDLSPGNILYKKENGKRKIYLVDINRMQFCTISYKKGVKNLAKLSITPEMVPIFVETFANYFHQSPRVVERDILRIISRFERKKKLKKLLKSLLWLR